MATFETSANRTSEQNVCDYIQKYLDKDLTISGAMNYRDHLDRGIIIKNTKELVAWIEIKVRKRHYSMVGSVSVSAHKIQAGINCSIATGVPFFFIVKFTESDHIKVAKIEHNALRSGFVYYGGMKVPRPNAPNDREFMLKIGINNFFSVQDSDLMNLLNLHHY